MKKISIISFVLLCLYACVDNTDGFDVHTLTPKNTCRSYEDAKAIAINAANSFFYNGENTRAGKVRQVKVDEDNTIVITRPVTRSINGGESESDTLLYIIDFEDEQGFAVVSANPNTEGLLAITDQGNYSETEAEDIKGFQQIMNYACQYVEQANAVLVPVTPIPFTDTLVVSEVLPRLGTQRWGQTAPEGYLCRNGVAGCVNIAIVEVMSKYEHPQTIELTYPERDVDVISLDWIDIKRHVVSGRDCDTIVNMLYEQYRCHATDSAHRNLARLCRQIGNDTHSIYLHENTGSFEGYIPQVFRKYGFAPSGIASYPGGITKMRLDNGNMIVMVGFDTSTDDGHAFVVDGYRELQIHSADIIPSTTIREVYNHVNWGWNGKYNGYFLDNIFHPYRAYRYDVTEYPNTFDNANYNFSDSLQYVTVSLR